MKHIKPYKDFVNESIESAVNEAASLRDYESALKSHDWYYQMSDSSQTYDRGNKEVQKIKNIYADLDDSDKTKAIGIWTLLYKKFYPESDRTDAKIEITNFNGY